MSLQKKQKEIKIRSYSLPDYDDVKRLYLQGDLYGGQFDEARDSSEKLSAIIQEDPQSILVCESDGQILGTISLIENARVAWFYRFAVARCEIEADVIKLLHAEACRILSMRGHTQVLVYSPDGDTRLSQRYIDLGMNCGDVYRCYWQDIGK